MLNGVSKKERNKTHLMRRVFLIPLLISSLSLFSQQTESIDTLEAVYVTSESQIIEFFYAARLNSYENYQARKDTPVVYSLSRRLYLRDTLVAEYHCNVFVSKRTFTPRVVWDSIHIIRDIETTSAPILYVPFQRLAISRKPKKIKKGDEKRIGSIVALKNTDSIELRYSKAVQMNAINGNMQSVFAGTNASDIALKESTWDGVMPMDLRKIKGRVCKGKNLFDPSSQLLLYHVNVTTINEFQEVVEATVDLGSKLKIDLEVNYPLLSGLDLFSLNELMSSTN